MAWRELSASGFYISATPSSSFVFLLTGMHGVHLLGGVIALLVAGLASLLHRSAQSQLVLVDITGLVLALHGGFVGLYFGSARVCAVTDERSRQAVR